MSRVKTAEPVEMPFRMWTRVGQRKHVLDGVHIGTTWRIRLNRPCAAVMQSFCQITLTTCFSEYAIPHPSVCRLSVCNAHAPY